MTHLDSAALARLLDEGNARRTTCPSADVLARAASPDADRRLREEVADHLGRCQRCAEEFRVAHDVAAWAETNREARAPRAASRAPLGWAYAAAAVFAIAAIGLGAELRIERRQAASAIRVEQQLADARAANAELRRRLQDDQTPEINAPIVELMPLARSRSASGIAPPPTVVPASSRRVALILNTTNPAPGSLQDVELVSNGGVVWRGTGLKQSRSGTLSVLVPTTLLGGEGTIRVYAPGTRTVLDEYRLPVIR